MSISIKTTAAIFGAVAMTAVSVAGATQLENSVEGIFNKSIAENTNKLVIPCNELEVDLVEGVEPAPSQCTRNQTTGWIWID